MRPRNKHGTPVDPVPFLVVATLAFAVFASFGPMYCVALGLSLPQGVAVSTAAFLASVVLLYHQLVWSFRPRRRREVPAGVRLRRLWYAVLGVMAALVLLALPLAAP